MTHLRRSLVLALITVGAVLPLHADEASKHQKIEDLFQLMQIDRTIDQVSTQQVAQAKQILKSMAPAGSMTEDQQKDVDAFLAKLVGITRDAVNWPKLEPQFVDLYASTYSEEEIDGILAFYRTPTGRSMIAKQPELLAKSQAITQAQLIPIQPKIREAVMQFLREMAAKRQQK